MKEGGRMVTFDADLGIEAYSFKGIVQKFPNHFHEYYVVGYIRSGLRCMAVGGRESIVRKGDLVLINPRQSHACWQVDEQALDWCGLHIGEETMAEIFEETTCQAAPLHFTQNQVTGSMAAEELAALHKLIMDSGPPLEKQERFYFLLQRLAGLYAGPVGIISEKASPQIQAVCEYIKANFSQPVSLPELAEVAEMNKFTLLRCFTKHQGMTPYQYLETIRIGKAKTMLERGIAPMKTALDTGFADQSHFTRFFKALIGVTPGQYQDIFSK